MSSTVRASLPALALALTCGSVSAQSLDGHPFRTLSPTALRAGGHEVQVGADYRTNAVTQPLLSAREGDLLQAPEIRHRIGFGRAELSIGGPAWQWLSPDGVSRDTDGPGDLSFWMVVTALRQRRSRVALGFAYGAKMPNADDEDGLGTDEADTFFAVLVGHASTLNEWRLNVGLAVLGDPAVNASQEDMLTYGLAGRHGRHHCIAWEIYGRTLSSDDARDLEESTLEAGYLYRGRRADVEVSLVHGLTRNSGDLGVSAGMAIRFADAVR